MIHRLRLIIICTLLIYDGLKCYMAKIGPPVVLVPGLGGAQLEAKLTGKPEVVHYFCSKHTDDFFDLWLNLELLLLGAIDCWTDNMKLVYNSTTGTISNMPGVEIRIPGFGFTENIEWLDKSKVSQGRYFSDIVEMLVNLGYSRGKSLRGAPFDWRIAPNQLHDYFYKLKALIEETHKYNGEKRVIIITHSMGSPVMLYFYNYFVNQDWKDKHIRLHISLGGAWGGSMQVMKLLASGYNMDYFRIIFPPSKLRRMQRTFTSSTFLFPSYNLWNSNEVLAKVGEKNYSLSNLREFFIDINFFDGWNQYQNFSKLLGELSAPNVELHCAYGYNVNTPEMLMWSEKYFPDYQPETIDGDGDGTVNRRSLETCKKWIGSNNGKEVSLYAINKSDHMDILKHPDALKLIKKLIKSSS